MPIDALRSFFLGRPGAGPNPAGNAFLLAFSAGLAGAAAVMALRLFVPGLAGMLPAFAGPVVCGGGVFLVTLVTLLFARGGADGN
jgi:hypothetical protein